MLNFPPVGNTNGNGIAPTHRFGVFEVDLRSGELRRSGMKVRLQEQPLQVLAQLLERPGEVVTREDLRNRLWAADTFVDFDHSLNAAIRRLRDALGDSAENPTFVETVARRGYRFLAPVTVLPSEANTAHGMESAPVVAKRHHPRWIFAVSGFVLVLLGVSLGFHVAKHVPVISYRVSQLTANPIDDPVRAAAISRDGRYLAFSDDNGFYLRQIDTGETHPIPLPNGGMATSINWFPDSVHLIVAFSDENRESSLWELSALGGSARKLIDDGRAPAVSPDGRAIAFFAGKPIKEGVWIAGITGEQPREVAGEDGDLFGNISWSPDSRKIAYTTAKFTYGYGTEGLINVVRINGRASERVSAPTNVVSLSDLDQPITWTPDGRLIYSLREPRPRQLDSNLWAVRLNGQLKREGNPIRLTNDAGSVLGISASGDSKRIAYVKGVPEPDVYIASLQPSGVLDQPQRLTLDDRQDIPYDWTADNKEVIFVSDRTGSFSIYRQAINQTVPELLVSGSPYRQLPRLSPDGTQLLYNVYPSEADPKQEVSLMRVPLAGGTPQQVAKSNWMSNHQCSRAPAAVCVFSVVSKTDLKFFTFDPLGGPGAQVFQMPDQTPELYNWSLSPDGTTLAIAKGKWGEEEPRIHLVSLKGSQERWLPLSGWPGISSLDWAADSKGLWATTSGEKENVLLYVDLQGNARAVWRPKGMKVGWAIPSRDGKHLALNIHSVSANVWMLERQ
jgi:Tol biopolymer transport system component/DNA-binding winged helix-turn-helix (wHTH) protein